MAALISELKRDSNNEINTVNIVSTTSVYGSTGAEVGIIEPSARNKTSYGY